MYKTTHDLTVDEMKELQETYYRQLVDDGTIKDEEIEAFCKISEDIIHEHYIGINFVDDDFFCNL